MTRTSPRIAPHEVAAFKRAAAHQSMPQVVDLARRFAAEPQVLVAAALDADASDEMRRAAAFFLDVSVARLTPETHAKISARAGEVLGAALAAGTHVDVATLAAAAAGSPASRAPTLQELLATFPAAERAQRNVRDRMLTLVRGGSFIDRDQEQALREEWSTLRRDMSRAVDALVADASPADAQHIADNVRKAMRRGEWPTPSAPAAELLLRLNAGATDAERIALLPDIFCALRVPAGAIAEMPAEALDHLTGRSWDAWLLERILPWLSSAPGSGDALWTQMQLTWPLAVNTTNARLLTLSVLADLPASPQVAAALMAVLSTAPAEFLRGIRATPGTGEVGNALLGRVARLQQNPAVHDDVKGAVGDALRACASVLGQGDAHASEWKAAFLKAVQQTAPGVAIDPAALAALKARAATSNDETVHAVLGAIEANAPLAVGRMESGMYRAHSAIGRVVGLRVGPHPRWEDRQEIAFRVEDPKATQIWMSLDCNAASGVVLTSEDARPGSRS